LYERHSFYFAPKIKIFSFKKHKIRGFWLKRELLILDVISDVDLKTSKLCSLIVHMFSQFRFKVTGALIEAGIYMEIAELLVSDKPRISLTKSQLRCIIARGCF
jgi:hypothetical protein